MNNPLILASWALGLSPFESMLYRHKDNPATFTPHHFSPRSFTTDHRDALTAHDIAALAKAQAKRERKSKLS